VSRVSQDKYLKKSKEDFMKKLFSTVTFTLTLALGIWTLAVTFAPVTSSFSAGEEVSATAFNDLFNAINDNFTAAKAAIEISETAIASLTSPPAASVGAANNQTVNNNSVFKLTFNTEAFDVGDLHDPGSSRLTAPEDGIYQISAMVTWSSNATGSRTLAVIKNGTLAQLADSRDAFAGLLSQSLSGLLALETGDFLEVTVFQDSGATLTLSSTTPLAFSMVKVGELP
jgi:hypothetical protein